MSSTQLPPVTILLDAKISQYLATISISAGGNYKAKATAQNLAKLIYAVRRAVQIRYDQNPADPTLITTANYLYDLCGRFALLAQARLNSLTVAPPVISGPANESVNVGQNAVFSTAVTSSVPYTVQWYDSSHNPIAGATSTTYTFLNAQLTDSGKTFYMKATNSAGTAVSATVTLTVTAALVGYYYFGSTDYSTILETNVDTVPYVGTFPITHGSPLTISLPSIAANTFMVFKYPSTETVKTNYTNLPINVGVIPSIAWNEVLTFGGWNYIFTRTGHLFGLNYLNPIVFS